MQSFNIPIENRLCGNSNCQQLCDEAVGSSYTCSCLQGYQLNNNTNCSGKEESKIAIATCSMHAHVDINECEGAPCDHGCENTVGSFECSCAAGYTLNSNRLRCDGMLLTHYLKSNAS